MPSDARAVAATARRPRGCEPWPCLHDHGVRRRSGRRGALLERRAGRTAARRTSGRGRRRRRAVLSRRGRRTQSPTRDRDVLRSRSARLRSPSAAKAGCVAHRGPLELPDGRRICQLRDPFGTIWGLEEAPASGTRVLSASAWRAHAQRLLWTPRCTSGGSVSAVTSPSGESDRTRLAQISCWTTSGPTSSTASTCSQLPRATLESPTRRETSTRARTG
jgi:hypothetical protein